MKPLLDVLVILDALEKEGSFAAASAKLFKTPSALSYTIHRLESDLNIQLLDRSGHRARFTPTGQMLLEKGREVLHIARELEIRAVKLQQGWEHTLRLAVDCTFPVTQLSPLIAAFYQQQPLTRLHFTQNPSLLDWRPLTDGQADLLLGALGEPPPLSGYDYLPLGELELLLVVSPQHPLARHRAPLSWRTLRRYRAVATGEGGALLRMGLGWGCLPRYQVQGLLESGELISMAVRGLSPRQHAWIAWNDATCGLASKWWRETLLANSAIFTIYHTEIV
ncbi:LysR family transcriptional regulator [Klebsiella variicola]|uniref:LysR family transcriptional regulator n=1 Tax=Klebsiella variicola TaxID=244366 RepID=UPI0028BA7F0B|nr:LysR substrate-binding domain-containing protein [Klebsiella variicola]MDT7006866.1 LysR family transcriptional regulator [Klebsiella variicola]MDT7025408.1 LysR family transcriptional regulator [Klebsiella variicola]